MILRVYNPSTESRTARIVFATQPSELHAVDLSEKRLSQIPLVDAAAVLTVGAAEIRTMEIIQ